jgi:hypothetical protein
MRKLALFLTIVFISTAFMMPAYGSAIKWIRIGSFQDKVVDSGDQGESSGEGTFGRYYFDGFFAQAYDSRGWHLGVKNWTDEDGNLVPYKFSNATHCTIDELRNTMPLPDAAGITIRRYLRYNPPSIIVDGIVLGEQFPMKGDEINPDKIPGTADVMVESWIRTSIGVAIHQKVLGWSQKYHDDYLIYDWTFKNTGNTDLDDEIELPNQTLTDLYFLRENEYGCWDWPSLQPWNSAYGEHPTDSLRIIYGYPPWDPWTTFDNFGFPDEQTGFITAPFYAGEAVLHVDKSPSDHSDDPSQPQMTGVQSPDLTWMRNEFGISNPADHALLYRLAVEGFKWFDGTPYLQDPPYSEDVYPGTHHGVRMDEQGYQYPADVPWMIGWFPNSVYSCGPYTLAPGDSIRIVWATVVGEISPEKAWEVGQKWKDGSCEWDGPNNLPPQAQKFPDLSPTDNDLAKDCWVASGKDSLFTNASAALWAVQNNYNVPDPPPAPSIEVKSEPDRIVVEWGDESESASDFAGYRVYRALGAPYYSEEGGIVVGKWERIFECEGTNTHSFEDRDVTRGVAYYYYVTAFDDGSQNNGIHPGESLESGKYLNMTTRAAYLTRSPGEKLSDIRVVPNPYNISAKELQYPGEPDKIMFMGLPPVCTIKIYSESGDLIRTIEHTDGSGDEAWRNPTGEHFLTSSSGQIVLSGIYIAHIESPDGESINVPFLIVR